MDAEALQPLSVATAQVAYKSWEAGWLGASAVVQSEDSPVQATPTSSPLALQTAQFALPDEYTKPLTGLLEPGLAPEAEAPEAAAPEAEATRHEVTAVDVKAGSLTWSWGESVFDSDHDFERSEEPTPTTSADRSTSAGSRSPAVCHLDLLAPSLSCQSLEGADSWSATSPAGRGDDQSPSEARMHQAQTLFASMLSPPSHKSQASRDRHRSEPPQLLTAGCGGWRPPTAGLKTRGGRGGTAATEKRPRRCLSCKPERSAQEPVAEGRRLQPLNGRMPRFPPADLNPSEQVQACRRDHLPEEKARNAG